jgi:plastocyanin domain-containing protein
MKKLIVITTIVFATLLLISGCGKKETNAGKAKLDGDIQTVNSTFTAGGYQEITVQVDVPVKWTINVDAGELTNCNNEFIAPKYDLEVKLKEGKTVVEFTPTETGTFPYSCWMGMIYSKINVVDSLAMGKTDKALASAESTNVKNDTYLPIKVSETPEYQVETATVNGDIQEVNVKVTSAGYEPSFMIVQKGLKTNFNFDVTQASCAEYVVFPQLAGTVNLAKSKTVMVIPQTDFQFQCDMGMFGSTVFVVDDLNGPEVEQIKQAIKANPEDYVFQGSGCGGGCCGGQ